VAIEIINVFATVKPGGENGNSKEVDRHFSEALKPTSKASGS
jgi:hypothetical protein